MSVLYRIIPFNIKHGNYGGSLVQFQQGEEARNALPFIIGKVLVSYDMKPDDVRGKHAHHETEEIVVALKGGCNFELDDGKGRCEYVRLGGGTLDQKEGDLQQPCIDVGSYIDSQHDSGGLDLGMISNITADNSGENLSLGENQDVQPALLLYPRIWRTFFDFEPDTVLLVVANKKYDEKDYIRDRSDFEHLAEDWDCLGGSASTGR